MSKVKNFGVTEVIPAYALASTTTADRIVWTEEKLLSQLAVKVHKAGYVGLSWPKLTKEKRLAFDGSHRQDLYITASVEAIPND